jgi:hypothetical protein
MATKLIQLEQDAAPRLDVRLRDLLQGPNDSGRRLQPTEMKQRCQTHCFSTLNHNLGYCYDDARVIRWVLKQASRGFQGVSGSFD